jgi:hypothetical protein
MSKNLAELLDEPEVVVESVVKKLEHLCGWESTDVRLLSEINNKVRAKISQLGLDPTDTTGPELYHALLAKLHQDEKSLNFSQEELIKQITKAHSGYNVYALKRSVAKDLLRKHPPRKLMKQLNYRSVESMIKRENVCGLYADLLNIESPRWLNVFYKDLAKLTPSDFETQNIEIFSMPANSLSPQNYNSTTKSVPLLGGVAVFRSSIGNINLAVHIAQSINELRSTSALIKYKNVEANFGDNLVGIIQNQTKHPLKISVLPISWHSIFNYYGQRPTKEHTEFFGPHLLHEDIKAHEPLKILGKISPVFNWWQGHEYVAASTKQGFVSLNLHDVAGSIGKTFDQRSQKHYRQSLWHEFLNRYLNHPSVEQHFMRQLEPQTVPVEDMQPSESPEYSIRQMIEAGI